MNIMSWLAPTRVVHAHCDLPCGVYDPAQARIEAESVKAIQEKYQGNDDAVFRERCVVIKEERSDLVKHHLWVLWTDYFKPEHLEKHPNLHDIFWKATKLTSTVKQSQDMGSAQQLLASCQQIAEIFWDTKGVQTKRQASNQGPVGGELVYPVG